jgi:hypothetical protein
VRRRRDLPGRSRATRRRILTVAKILRTRVRVQEPASMAIGGPSRADDHCEIPCPSRVHACVAERDDTTVARDDPVCAVRGIVGHATTTQWAASSPSNGKIVWRYRRAVCVTIGDSRSGTPAFSVSRLADSH